MTANDTLQDWLKANIASLVAYPVDRITQTSDLRDDLGLDSSDLMFLQLKIEERIGAPLEYDENIKLYSFGDLLDSIEKVALQNT